METKTILLDSSIIIEYFRKQNKSKSVLYDLSEKYHFCISAITVFEIQIGLKTEKQWEDYQILTSNMEILPVDELCIDEAVNIYHFLKEQNNLLELSDLFIAATAKSNTLPLATLNVKHFEKVKGLELLLK